MYFGPILFFAVAAIVAIVIYVLSSLAGTTGNPADVVKAREYLFYNFGLPVIIVTAALAALSMFRSK